MGDFEMGDPGRFEGFGSAPACDELESEGAQAAARSSSPVLS